MREDEAVDSFASMFQAGFAAEPERIEKRQRAERRSSQTTKQRKRGALRTTQINYRCSVPYRQLADRLKDHLASKRSETVSIADVMEEALALLAKAEKVGVGE